MFDYNKIDWQKNGNRTILDLYSCIFHLDENGSDTFTFHINSFSCNGTDLNCATDSIFDGPFTVTLDRTLPLCNIKDVDYDEDEPAVIINGVRYKVVNSDFYYFTGDFKADAKQAHGNLMKHLAEFIKKEYM